MEGERVSFLSTMNMPMQFAPPPRRVPISLELASIFNGISQFGWLFFGFGMIFFWVFVGHADFSVVTFRGDIAQTTGKVVRVEETGASENETAVMANHYEYSVAGQRLSGTSYTTGADVSPGQEVTVEFAQGNPLRSRIAGMRRAQFGPWISFVGIFPLVGLLILYFAMKSGFRRAQLLRRGVLTTGKLIDKEPTNVTVNDRRVYELTFEFTARDGRRCEAKARTSDPSRLEDEHAEPLLYDPEETSRAYLLDEVPGRPEIDGTGELVGHPMRAVLLMIVPGLVIGGHVLYFVTK
jgi:hypothetical protein